MAHAALATVHTYRPRERRDEERRRCAESEALRSGKGALDRALIAVGMTNDSAARINRHKLRVAQALRKLPGNQDIRCWFSCVSRLIADKRARTIGDCLMHISIETLRTMQLEDAICRPLLNKRQQLAEARLALRWLRRHQPLLDVAGLTAAMNRGPDRRPVVELVAAE